MRMLLLAAALMFALVSTACGGAQTQTTPVAGPERPAEAVCPVMKNKFKPGPDTEFAEYKGQTYWFCCPGCRGKFLADPEKYVPGAPAAAPTPGAPAPTPAAPAPAAAAEGAQPAAAPAQPANAEVTCLISGEKFTPGPDTPSVTHEGKTYQFCCPGCAKKFQADPAKYLKQGAPAAPSCDCSGDAKK